MQRFIILLGLMGFGWGLFAQQAQEQLDVEQFKKEIEDKLSSFELDISSALKEMESAMGSMIFESDGNVIINGDTIIIAPGGELPEGMENFGDIFKQAPEGGTEGFQFFFGDENMDGFSEMFQKLKDQLDHAFDFKDFNMEGMEEGESGRSPEKREEKSQPKKKKEAPTKKKNEKKRKTYTL